MKIGILGGGSAAAIALLVFQKTFNQYKISDIELCSIYDPDIPMILVGESSTPKLTDLLISAFDPEKYNLIFPNVLDDFNGTFRWYTHYFWKNMSGEDFIVNNGYPGIHLNSEKFSNWVFDKISKVNSNYSIIHATILDVTYNNKELFVHTKNQKLKFDFIIDCRGTPTTEKIEQDYSIPDFESVNSVILYPEFKNYKEEFTSGISHDNGWMFGVPLQHRKTFGYLYNNKITNKETAIEHFSELKGIDASTCKTLSWKHYYKKKAIDNKILSLGNRLYFFEPAQSLPLHYYINVVDDFLISLLNGNSLEQISNTVNTLHVNRMEELQDLIAINYAGESDQSKDFWKYARKSSINRLSTSKKFINWCDTVIKQGWQPYGFHPATMMRLYCEGYKINLKEIMDNKK